MGEGGYLFNINRVKKIYLTSKYLCQIRSLLQPKIFFCVFFLADQAEPKGRVCTEDCKVRCYSYCDDGCCKVKLVSMPHQNKTRVPITLYVAQHRPKLCHGPQCLDSPMHSFKQNPPQIRVRPSQMRLPSFPSFASARLHHKSLLQTYPRLLGCSGTQCLTLPASYDNFITQRQLFLRRCNGDKRCESLLPSARQYLLGGRSLIPTQGNGDNIMEYANAAITGRSVFPHIPENSDSSKYASVLDANAENVLGENPSRSVLGGRIENVLGTNPARSVLGKRVESVIGADQQSARSLLSRTLGPLESSSETDRTTLPLPPHMLSASTAITNSDINLIDSLSQTTPKTQPDIIKQYSSDLTKSITSGCHDPRNLDCSGLDSPDTFPIVKRTNIDQGADMIGLDSAHQCPMVCGINCLPSCLSICCDTRSISHFRPIY